MPALTHHSSHYYLLSASNSTAPAQPPPLRWLPNDHWSQVSPSLRYSPSDQHSTSSSSCTQQIASSTARSSTCAARLLCCLRSKRPYLCTLVWRAQRRHQPAIHQSPPSTHQILSSPNLRLLALFVIKALVILSQVQLSKNTRSCSRPELVLYLHIQQSSSHIALFDCSWNIWPSSPSPSYKQPAASFVIRSLNKSSMWKATSSTASTSISALPVLPRTSTIDRTPTTPVLVAGLWLVLPNFFLFSFCNNILFVHEPSHHCTTTNTAKLASQHLMMTRYHRWLGCSARTR